MERNNYRIIQKYNFLLIFILFPLLIFIDNCKSEDNLARKMDSNISVKKQTRESFSSPIPALKLTKMRLFTGGRHLFRRTWITAPGSVKNIDGLGPVFNRNSCSGCHVKDGRGRPPRESEELRSMVFKLGLIRNNKSHPDPNYGIQLNDKAILGVPFEGKIEVTYNLKKVTYSDGKEVFISQPIYLPKKLSFGPLDKNTAISGRVAPAVFGLGLIEAIDEETLKNNADPEDKNKDGISGKYNMVWDEPSKIKMIGRFGWKASRGSLLHQIVGAAHEDMGLTSYIFPKQNCLSIQKKCLKQPNGGDPELSKKQINRLLLYIQTLASPRQRNSEDKNILKGENLFRSIGCEGCHTSTFKTSEHPNHPELSNKIIKPYSDFLLHDMGENLADHMPSFKASGSEWRTAPLWGIGLVEIVNKHTRFLHDGRAKSLEEAILWHGGEGKKSKELFIKLDKEERKLLLDFIKSL